MTPALSTNYYIFYGEDDFLAPTGAQEVALSVRPCVCL